MAKNKGGLALGNKWINLSLETWLNIISNDGLHEEIKIPSKTLKKLAAYKYYELQKALKLHFLISLQHFKRFSKFMNMYLSM